jgi:hypothetical protein
MSVRMSLQNPKGIAIDWVKLLPACACKVNYWGKVECRTLLEFD